MKPCPRCQEYPDWRLGRNTTVKRADGEHYFTFTGCRHVEDFAKNLGFVANSTRPTHEARWDEQAEKLFVAMTERWTDPERTSFRVRVFRETPTTQLQF